MRLYALLLTLLATTLHHHAVVSENPDHHPAPPGPPAQLGIPPVATAQAEKPARHTLHLDDGAADLRDVLGPLVINKDGTTARITNWGQMSPGERETTLRVVVARNRKRLAVLRAQAGRQESTGVAAADAVGQVFSDESGGDAEHGNEL